MGSTMGGMIALAGFVLMVVGAWIYHWVLGMVALGFLLVLVGTAYARQRGREQELKDRVYRNRQAQRNENIRNIR